MRRQFNLSSRAPSPQQAQILRQSLKIGSTESVNIRNFQAHPGATASATRAAKLPAQAFRKTARAEHPKIKMSDVLSQLKKNIHMNPMYRQKIAAAGPFRQPPPGRRGLVKDPTPEFL